MEEELASLAQGEYKKQMDLLTSIKGIGVTLAAALIVATGRFSYFDNAKQLTRYLGLSPTYQQSGTSVNVKGHINRNGDSSLRSQLYVAAFSSLRCNTECKACFDRLRSNGKPGKVVVIAVANKLVRQAFAVVTQGKPYVDGFKSEKP
ncbi:transposase [Bacteroides finegoldii CAG:203]|nr:transposase [Bacteroides finegoldii CAG:203]